MSRALREFFRRDPITVDNTVAPADVIPPGHVVVGTPELDRLERDARMKAAARLVHRTLLAESLKPEGMRNPQVVDVLLDLRSILQPAPAGAEVLREAPPVGVRYPVPVVPGVGSFRGYVQ